LILNEVIELIRLRRNTLQLAAGMKGKVNRTEAYQSEGELISLYLSRWNGYGAIPL
jgi:hypothetical protein